MLTIPTAFWPYLLSKQFRPVEVYEIEAFAGRSALYLASHALTWGGHDYVGLAVERSDIKYTMELKVPDCAIVFSNVTNALRAHLAPVDTLTGARLTVRLLLRDGADALLSDSVVLFKGRIEPPSDISETDVSINVVGLLDGAGMELPGRNFGVSCPWDYANAGAFDGGGHCAYQSSTTANGAGTASTTLIVTAASTFANYDVIQIGGGASVTILSGGGGTTLGLSEARTWSNGATVRYADCSRMLDACTKRAQLYRMGGFPLVATTQRLDASTRKRDRPFDHGSVPADKGARFALTRLNRLNDQKGGLANTTDALPVIVGEMRVEPLVIEVIRDTVADKEYRVLVYGVCEGPIDSVRMCLAAGGDVVDVVESSVKTFGVYIRLGGVGVNDTETVAEYAADAATRVRSQNIDYRSGVGIANSETAYVMFIRKADPDMEDFPKFEVQLRGVLIQAYNADGTTAGAPAWSKSPVWASLLLCTSDRFGLRMPTSDFDFAAAKASADYCAEEIPGTEASTLIKKTVGSSTSCKVLSAEGFIVGKRVDINGVANTIDDILNSHDMLLGTAVAQTAGQTVRQWPSRFEAHVEMNDVKTAMDWLRLILGTCRGYISYDAGKLQFRVERDTVTERLTDGGFEVWTSPTNLTNWTEGITGGTVNREATIIDAGTYSLRLDKTGAGSLYVSGALPSLEPGRWYRIEVRARASAALAGGVRVIVYDSTQALAYNVAALAWEASSSSKQSITGDATTAFQTFEVTFLVPSTFGVADSWLVEIHYGSATTGQSMYYDAATLRGPYAGDFREFTAAQVMGWKEGSFDWSVDKKDREINRATIRLHNRSGNIGRDLVVLNDYPHQRTHAVKTMLIDGEAIDSRDQAYRIASFQFAKKRTLGFGCKFLGSPAALAVQPGDILVVSHTVPSWTRKEQRVTQIAILGRGDPDEHFVRVTTEDYSEAIYSDVGPPQATLPEPDAYTLVVSVIRNGGGVLELSWTLTLSKSQSTYYTVHRSATTGFAAGLTNQIGQTSGLTFTYLAQDSELDVVAFYRVLAHHPLELVTSDEFAATIFSADATIPPGTGYSNNFQFPATIVTPKDGGTVAFVNESGAAATVAKVTDASDTTYLKATATATDGVPDGNDGSIEYHSFGAAGSKTGRAYVRADRVTSPTFGQLKLYYTLDRTAGTPTWVLWQSVPAGGAITDYFGPELTAVDYTKFAIKAKVVMTESLITRSTTGKNYRVAFDEKA